jgi:hypothetical protein
VGLSDRGPDGVIYITPDSRETGGEKRYYSFDLLDSDEYDRWEWKRNPGGPT